MQIIRSISHMQRLSDRLRQEGRRIAFVPTMGALHRGHLSLVELAGRHGDSVIMSIFVNPTQFGAGEDLSRYPRNFERDEKRAAEAGVEVLFYPEEESMYAPGHMTWVVNEGMTDILCGASRPGHFRGVTTVVMKLLHIVKAHVLVLGQKDAQQAAVLGRMLEDMNMETELLLGGIVREEDGLAMSSRNVYLDSASRSEALHLYQALNAAESLIRSGERRMDHILDTAKRVLLESGSITLDYLEFRTFPELRRPESLQGRILLAAAIFLADVRLIDNIIMELDPVQ